MLDRERLELAAKITTSFLSTDLYVNGRGTYFGEFLDGIVDCSLRIADRLIAACTEPEAVVGQAQEVAP